MYLQAPLNYTNDGFVLNVTDIKLPENITCKYQKVSKTFMLKETDHPKGKSFSEFMCRYTKMEIPK